MTLVEGNLQLIIGPMFSGKSTELIRRVRRYQHARLECLVVKYMFDDRYSEEYVMLGSRSSPLPGVACVFRRGD